ncbi:hypothetical protein RDI58_022573 [Solanum bulbocastanum]|uniref:Uncharacterized protein n=1 Tax=Solanum bulbocastanum TaxID=147425 RepID=A0AAN8T2W8_SOLBU
MQSDNIFLSKKQKKQTQIKGVRYLTFGIHVNIILVVILLCGIWSIHHSSCCFGSQGRVSILQYVKNQLNLFTK